jgi:BMFP domain-containing protein YqiC
MHNSGACSVIELRKIEELAENIAKVLPVGTDQVRAELRGNIRLVLESAFARMNLVTREEFDAQTALLRRTREKLEELERIVAEMDEGDS